MKLIDKVEAKLVRRIQADIADLVFNAQLDEKSIIGIIRPEIADFDRELVGVTYNYIKYLIYLKSKGENEVGAFDKFIRKLNQIDNNPKANNPIVQEKVLSKEMLLARNKEREKIAELYEVLHEDNAINYDQFYGLKKAAASEKMDATLINQMEVEDSKTELKLEQNYQTYLDSSTDPTINLQELDNSSEHREDKEQGGLNEEMEDLKANVAILSDQVIYLQSTISNLKEQLANKNDPDLTAHVTVDVNDDTLQAPLNDPDHILNQLDNYQLADHKKKKKDDDQDDEVDPLAGEIPGDVEVVVIVDDEFAKDQDESEKKPDDDIIQRKIDGQLSEDPDSIPTENISDEIMPDLPKSADYQETETEDPIEITITVNQNEDQDQDVEIDEVDRPVNDDHTVHQGNENPLPDLDSLDDEVDENLDEEDHEPTADEMEDIEPLVLEILDEIQEIDDEQAEINNELAIDQTIDEALKDEVDEIDQQEESEVKNQLEILDQIPVLEENNQNQDQNNAQNQIEKEAELTIEDEIDIDEVEAEVLPNQDDQALENEDQD
jgi:hypothetical protein